MIATSTYEDLRRRVLTTRRAYARLGRAAPSPREAQFHANECVWRLTDLLDDADVVAEMDELIADVRESGAAETIVLTLGAIRQEAQLARHFETPERAVRRLAAQCRRDPRALDEYASSTAAIRDRLLAVHRELLESIDATRSLPKARKASEKRRLLGAADDALNAVAILLSNSRRPEMFAFSYRVGGRALVA